MRPKRLIHKATCLRTCMIVLGLISLTGKGLTPFCPQNPQFWAPPCVFNGSDSEASQPDASNNCRKQGLQGLKRRISAGTFRPYRPKCQSSPDTPLIYPLIPKMGRQCISNGNMPNIKGIAYTNISSERLGRLKSNFAHMFRMSKFIT